MPVGLKVETVADDAGPLERDAELRTIDRLLDQGSTSAGRLLVIEGPSGIGRSRLLEETIRRAHSAGMDVLAARAGELETGYPFEVALRLLEPRVAKDAADILDGRAALAAPLLAPATIESGASVTNETELVRGLYWCVVNICRRRAAVLVVDDCHWADEPSLRFLNYLVRRLDDLPLLVVLAVRTGDPTARGDLIERLVHASGSVRLRLRELSPDATRYLLRQGADRPISDEFAEACWTMAKGNPLLVGALVHALREELVPEEPDAAALTELARQDVEHVVARRLRRLGALARRLALACSVLGDDHPIATGVTLAQLGSDAGVVAAARLAEAQILSSAGSTTFEHPIVRSAVYAQLDAAERRAIHLRAARLQYDAGWDPSVVAAHLLKGEIPDEPWAVEALRAGARVVSRRGSPELAVGYLQRALELASARETEAGLLLELGIAEAASGRSTSLERFERALPILKEPADQATALHALGQTLYRRGRHQEAIDAFRRGASLFVDLDDDSALMFEAELECAAIILNGYGLSRLSASVRESARRAPVTAADRVALAVSAFCSSLSGPDLVAAGRLAEQALGDGALLREQTAEGMAVKLAILALAFSGRSADAVREAGLLLEDARERGVAVAFAEGSMVRAVAHFALGHISEAMADAQAAIDGEVTRDWHMAGVVPRSIRVVCLLERGELVEAAAEARGAEAELIGCSGHDAWLSWARGRVLFAEGDTGGALDSFRLAGRLAEDADITNPEMIPWRTDAALAAFRAGDAESGLRWLDDEERGGQAIQLPGTSARVARVRALACPPRERIRSLEAAISGLELPGLELELARGLVDLAVARRQVGDRTASRDGLRRAVHLAHALGATALERRARDELLASGARPRRAALVGINSLTPSEARIARLAAEGTSNRAIADMLFLTKGTVAWHLGRVYRKLGISSREELRTRLDVELG
jgi:DNA-binding CsgD family transcriptional regulator